MSTLTTALKTILNGLAMQYEGDYLSDDDKKANLQRVLADIEREKQQPATRKSVSSLVSPTTDVALNAK
jgi:hypothetical protein